METKMTRSITEILDSMQGRAETFPVQESTQFLLVLSALRKAIEELEKHTERTTGYYSGMCTGDSYDAQETLKEIAAILKGEAK